jgi:hypothetical protein
LPGFFFAGSQGRPNDGPVESNLPRVLISNQTPRMKANSVENLSPRHVKQEEATRLGVQSGWYSTKVSGTFVSGPHDSESACAQKIIELNPPPKVAKSRIVSGA